MIIPFGVMADAGKIEYYAEIGFEEVVFRVPPAPADVVLPIMDRLAEFCGHRVVRFALQRRHRRSCGRSVPLRSAAQLPNGGSVEQGLDVLGRTAEDDLVALHDDRALHERGMGQEDLDHLLGGLDVGRGEPGLLELRVPADELRRARRRCW